MEAKLIKENMYDTPWTVDSDTEVGNNDFCILDLRDNRAHIDMTDIKANAAAIVSAVNGTWGNGINPEKLTLVMSALECVINNQGKISNEQLQTVKQIYNSAKRKPNH